MSERCTFQPCISNRRGVNYLHLPTRFRHIQHAIAETFHSSIHRFFDNIVSSIDMVNKLKSSRKNRNPEYIRLPERKTCCAQQHEYRRTPPSRPNTSREEA